MTLFCFVVNYCCCYRQCTCLIMNCAIAEHISIISVYLVINSNTGNEKTKIQTRQYIYSSNTGISTSIPCKLISYFNFHISRANLFFSMFSFCFSSFSFSISKFLFFFFYVCNFLPCPSFVPRSYRRGILCFQNKFSLLVLFQKYTFFSIYPIWLPLRHFS